MGSPGQAMQFQRFTPEQQGALSSLLGTLSSTGLGGLQGILGSGGDFSGIENQARQDFDQKTLPTIAERFTQLGGQRSSAFPQILGQAGAGLESSLAAQRGQYNLQRGSLGLNALNTALTPQYENVYQPRQSGFLENSLLGGVQGAASSLPFWFR